MNEQIEAIRNEIGRRKKENMYDELPMTIGRYYEDRDLLSFIDSLPEEPDKGVDVTDFCKPIDPGIAQCVADHWWEMLDDEEQSNRPKLSDNLEEAAEKYENEHTFRKYKGGYYSDITMSDAFKAGAKWQADQEKDEWLKDRDGCFCDGVEEGKKAMEERMLKEAVEGTVMDFSSNRPRPQVDVLLDPHKYHTGDKVRIIIVKED